jgi:hypothetical protein
MSARRPPLLYPAMMLNVLIAAARGIRPSLR